MKNAGAKKTPWEIRGNTRHPSRSAFDSGSHANTKARTLQKDDFPADCPVGPLMSERQRSRLTLDQHRSQKSHEGKN